MGILFEEIHLDSRQWTSWKKALNFICLREQLSGRDTTLVQKKKNVRKEVNDNTITIFMNDLHNTENSVREQGMNKYVQKHSQEILYLLTCPFAYHITGKPFPLLKNYERINIFIWNDTWEPKCVRGTRVKKGTVIIAPS